MKSTTQKELAEKVGVTPARISQILNRRERPSAELAAKLEEATDIDRRAWLWPDEFPNSMLKADPDQAA